MKVDRRVRQRRRRVGEAMADLETESFAIEAHVEDRPGKSWSGCPWVIDGLALVEVEDAGPEQASAIVGDDEVESGETVHLAAPHAGEMRAVGLRLDGRAGLTVAETGGE